MDGHHPCRLPRRAQEWVDRTLTPDSRSSCDHICQSISRYAPSGPLLDKQLVGNASTLSGQGFGTQVRAAMRDRVDFLATQGLAEWRDRGPVFVKDLLATLRDRDLAAAGRALEQQTRTDVPPDARGRARKRHLPPLNPAGQRPICDAG